MLLLSSNPPTAGYFYLSYKLKSLQWLTRPHLCGSVSSLTLNHISFPFTYLSLNTLDSSIFLTATGISCLQVYEITVTSIRNILPGTTPLGYNPSMGYSHITLSLTSFKPLLTCQFFNYSFPNHSFKTVNYSFLYLSNVPYFHSQHYFYTRYFSKYMKYLFINFYCLSPCNRL